MFTEDQEYLISMHGQLKFDYVEGFVIVDEGLVNNWRSSFFSPRNPVKISSVSSNGSVLYCLEITKNYHDSDSETVDQVTFIIHLEKAVFSFFILMNIWKDLTLCDYWEIIMKIYLVYMIEI